MVIMTSKDNIKAAFAGESQANRKYTYFSAKAEQEGFKNMARLFRAAAEAEAVHAENHLKTMKGVNSTKENVQTAIDGERYENTKMYPEFIKAAQKEKDAPAEKTFSWANSVEKIHQTLYEKAMKSISSGKDIAKVEYSVCTVCGNTFEGNAPDICPVCGAPKRTFRIIK
jgi:rubrerythrin